MGADVKYERAWLLASSNPESEHALDGVKKCAERIREEVNAISFGPSPGGLSEEDLWEPLDFAFLEKLQQTPKDELDRLLEKLKEFSRSGGTASRERGHRYNDNLREIHKDLIGAWRDVSVELGLLSLYCWLWLTGPEGDRIQRFIDAERPDERGEEERGRKTPS